ncbi:ATP-DEPENDENT RNA HELICASE DBP3 [Salix koriyanagi]|uniref:ATP-DEPENDENT RNA HELICASE DBP3 n=1 Tax=Salix koriyanagi TaxID=2511006 RepID=A0A9Q0T4W2_9ROSI|nr:ATP-DEPENDENT RNA HELICASE DBP3 [Salix koriyanagi]
MEEEDNYVEYVPVAKRRALTAQMILQRRGNSSALEDELEKSILAEAKPSLLVKASQLKRDQPEISQTEQIVQQEKEMIEHLSDKKTLMSVRELAKGITYTEPLLTGWKPPFPKTRLNDPMEDGDTITTASGVKGCAYCGGLGHRIRDCPKLDHQRSQQLADSRRDYFGSGGYRGEI